VRQKLHVQRAREWMACARQVGSPEKYAAGNARVVSASLDLRHLGHLGDWEAGIAAEVRQLLPR
jgi:hypothetical protein